MGVPRPEIPLPHLPVVARVFAQLGLARPTQIQALAPPWVHANYRISFDDRPDLLLRRLVSDPGVDTLRREAAALALLRDRSLHTVQNYRVLPEGAFPWPAAVSEILPGVQGIAVMRQHPELGSAICGAIGEWMGTLAQVSQPGPATGERGLRFVATRPTWREEWGSWVFRWWRAATDAGTALGPLGDALYTRCVALLPALDSATQFSLVHGDLHPSNFLFARPAPGESPPISGVIDWEGALIGDPLLEWALMVELPVETLGHILHGLPEQVQQVLADPDALLRLECYALSRALRRLAFCNMSLFRGDGGVRRSYALEYGRMVAEERLRTTIEAKLHAARQSGTQGEIIQRVVAPRAHRVLWQSLEVLRFRPILQADGVVRWLGTLAAGLLSLQAGESWRELALRWAAQCGPQHTSIPGEPIPDRDAWSLSVAQACTHRSVATVAWWLVHEAERCLQDAEWSPVSASILRGLEGVIRSTALDTSATPALAFVSALLTKIAEQRLQRMGVPVFVDTDLELAPLWEDLTVFSSAPSGEVDLDGLLVSIPTTQSVAPLVPVVLYGLACADIELPASIPRVLCVLQLVETT